MREGSSSTDYHEVFLSLCPQYLDGSSASCLSPLAVARLVCATIIMIHTYDLIGSVHAALSKSANYENNCTLTLWDFCTETK